MRSQDLYLDFESNPSLADALADCNVGDTCKVELEFLVKSKDDKGISAVIQPGTIVPEGYEQEDSGEEGTDTTPAPQPPGSLATAPVEVAMAIRKKK